MTPSNKPAANDAKKPVDPPPPPADVKADAKVEVKADAKVAEPPKDEKAEEVKADEKPPIIDFKDWSAYSLVIGGGYGWRDMGNDQGFDHGGGHARIGAGLNFRFGERFKLTPRLFYEHQALGKDLGEGIKSDAHINTVGLEGIASFAIVPNWFSLGAGLGLGAAIYGSSDTTDGLNGGTEFNKNALKFPLSGTAFRFDIGLNVGIWDDAFNIYGKYALDSGLNPKLDVVDGNYPPMGLSPGGFVLGANVDLLAIGNNIWGKKNKKVTTEPAPKPGPDGQTPPDKQPAPVKPGAPADKATPPVKVAGVALFEQRAKEVKELAAKAKGHADSAKQNNTDVKKEKDASKAKGLAMDARSSSRLAVEQVQTAEAYIAELELELEKLEGEDKKKAAAMLKDIKKDADAANDSARTAWDQASAAVKEYNKGKPAAEQVDFPDSKPEAKGRPAGKPAPKKDPPKKDPPKADPPKTDPKKDPPKTDPKKDPPKGGPIDFGD